MCMFPTKQGFPCGKCIDCLSKKRNDWSIRLQYEYNYWLSRMKQTYMALLTYDDEHAPRTKNGTLTLRQSDVQKFMKRLRKRLSKDGIFIRFFYCGEYGPNRTRRPHYHILLFGFPMLMTKTEVFNIVQEAWYLGFVGNGFDIVHGEKGIHYCTKYMINKALKLPDNECEKPFTRMSKGLGMSFMFDVVEDKHGIHKGKKLFNVEARYNPLALDNVDSAALFYYQRTLDLRSPEAIELAKFIQSRYMDRVWCNGSRFKMPRYYRDRLFDCFERYLINFSDTVLHWLPADDEYRCNYQEYDETHEIPMKMLIAIEKTNRLISNYIKTHSDKV